MRNLPDGIMLDSAQTFIPYGCPRRKVEALLAEHGIPMEPEPSQEDSFCVRSKMLGTIILCRVCLGFENEAFAGAVFAALEPPEAMGRVFFVFQQRLESLLGQRGKPPQGSRLFGQSSTYTEYTWETGGIYAQHTFSDRFAPSKRPLSASRRLPRQRRTRAAKRASFAAENQAPSPGRPPLPQPWRCCFCPPC